MSVLINRAWALQVCRLSYVDQNNPNGDQWWCFVLQVCPTSGSCCWVVLSHGELFSIKCRGAPKGKWNPGTLDSNIITWTLCHQIHFNTLNTSTCMKFINIFAESWKLKWAFLIACCLSSVCKLFTFSTPLQNLWATFNQTWHKASLGGRDPSCSNEGPRPFLRGGNSENVKLYWKY